MTQGSWRGIVLLVTLGALGACEAEREPPPPVEDTVFDGQVRALDRASDVQRVTEEQEQKLRRAVEDAEGG